MYALLFFGVLGWAEAFPLAAAALSAGSSWAACWSGTCSFPPALRLILAHASCGDPDVRACRAEPVPALLQDVRAMAARACCQFQQAAFLVEAICSAFLLVLFALC